MTRGFVYLMVVMDWYSRRVLSHRISITMDTSFCLDVLEEAVEKYDKPDIINTDQGSQFTSLAFTKFLQTTRYESAWMVRAPGLSKSMSQLLAGTHSTIPAFDPLSKLAQ